VKTVGDIMERRTRTITSTPSHVRRVLRRRAEDRARELSHSESALLETKWDQLTPDAMQQVMHQLQVHQIELEMQNEELRNTQLQLETARLRYFDLYDLAPVGYCSLSEQGVILEANLLAANLLGWDRSALVSQMLSHFILAADQDIYYLHRKQLFSSMQAQTCELRMLKADDTAFWAQLKTSIEEDAQGVSLLRIVIGDISERKRTESILRESEERYRNLFNSIDEGFCVIEMIYEQEMPVDYRFIEVNPSFEQQCGLHDATGKRVLEMVPDFNPLWFEIYGRVAETGEPIRIEDEVQALGRWFDVYAFRVGVQESKKVAVIFSNTTLRKQAEAQKALLDQALQDNNIQLEHATAAAEKANLAKSDFLSNMSHELRTPLNAILGFAQMLELSAPALNAKQKGNVDQILQGGWYLLKLINDILDLALIESGKLLIFMEPVSLSQVINECQTMIEPQAEKRDIRLYVAEIENIDASNNSIDYFVQADHTRLKQVLLNLLSNAIKYNKVGGTVFVKCFEKPLGRMRICIEDSGEGLSLEQIALLFQPFNRLGQETGTEEGTGIGLVMTKRLIELMDGEMGVESTTNKGSVFWVELNTAPKTRRLEKAQPPSDT
jgi:PAS domain S-box-containing protein